MAVGYMVWDPLLDTGIDIIDEQHKGIVNYINQLHEASLTNDRDKVSLVLMGLINYTVSHFSFEENLLEQHGYELLDAHKQVHQSFIDQIKKYRAAHMAGKNIAKPLVGELQIWLANHIKNEDAHYAKKIRNKQFSTSVISKMVKKFFG